jgi:hypothetical protein
MDVRLTKQLAQPLTTTGLATAKSNMMTGKNKVFITAECRIKSATKKDQKNTDFDCGQWGKPWSKETYLSGNSCYYPFCLLFHETDMKTEVLDDYLATLNVRWSNQTGMSLIRLV